MCQVYYTQHMKNLLFLLPFLLLPACQVANRGATPAPYVFPIIVGILAIAFIWSAATPKPLSN